MRAGRELLMASKTNSCSNALKYIASGATSAMMACSGGAVLLVQAANTTGLPSEALLSWFFSVYVIGGILNTFLTLRYRIPFAGAHSITGIAFIGSTAVNYSLPELSGGFILSGFIIFIVGCTGIFSRALQFVPEQTINALLAGLLFTYVWGIVPATIQLPLCGILAAIGYFFMPRFTKALPPAIWAFLLSIVGLLLQKKLPMPLPPNHNFHLPIPIIPEFTIAGVVSIALPLSLLILSNDLAVALASLKSHHYEPPVNRTLAASGISSMIVGYFGGHAANVGGMMTALCSNPEAGDVRERIRAAMTSNVLIILFGLFSWKMISWIQILPAPFIALLTGYPLFALFLKAIRSAFKERSYWLSSLVTVIIALIHMTILGISTPVWALLAGVLIIKWNMKIRKK